jgi:hypothetical protein
MLSSDIVWTFYYDEYCRVYVDTGYIVVWGGEYLKVFEYSVDFEKW